MTPSKKKLPVLFWVHGGSQIVSFGSAASKVGDVHKLIRDSAGNETPIIVVSVQYRLNIFHVGDGNSNKNLGFKDLQCAVEWVREHIAGFGGDPDEITIAGESAGAALTHALVVAGAQVKRAIIMSGSLHMSPPQPETRARIAIIQPVLEVLKTRGYHELKTAPASEVIEAMVDVSIKSVFLQADGELADWSVKTGNIQELIIGDVQKESVLFSNGIRDMSLRQVFEAFDKAGQSAQLLKTLYHVKDGRPNAARQGALDFLNDRLWGLPVWTIADRFREQGKKVYTYIFDQANPWQWSAGAHHAVDLIFLFGGFNLAHDAGAFKLSADMRRRFALFLNGEEPWSADKTCAFGPCGQVQEISAEEVSYRRRMLNYSQLRKIPPADLAAVTTALAAGKISLHV